MSNEIYIGIGSNLPSPQFGPPLAILSAAIGTLAHIGLTIPRQSSCYLTTPVPASDQPNFLNGVLEIESTLPPDRLLACLHAVEAAFGRTRGHRNAARILDLDLLVYGDLVIAERDGLTIPHPRLHNRAFVLVPFADVAPHWRHPVLGRSVRELERSLEECERLRSVSGNPEVIPQVCGLPAAVRDA